MEINTKSDLKHAVTLTGSPFFSRESMKFFGDTMSNYRLSKKQGEARIHQVLNHRGEIVPCYKLERIRSVKGGLKNSQWFSVRDLRTICGEEK